mmetsp:Transcript_74681/g.178159  ORF Transcript_74681/g.178159 Transcript_74681/m.178159 type:complete len:274 (-) Transcript_74681:59-880(-)
MSSVQHLSVIFLQVVQCLAQQGLRDVPKLVAVLAREVSDLVHGFVDRSLCHVSKLVLLFAKERGNCNLRTRGGFLANVPELVLLLAREGQRSLLCSLFDLPSHGFHDLGQNDGTASFWGRFCGIGGEIHIVELLHSRCDFLFHLRRHIFDVVVLLPNKLADSGRNAGAHLRLQLLGHLPCSCGGAGASQHQKAGKLRLSRVILRLICLLNLGLNILLQLRQGCNFLRICMANDALRPRAPSECWSCARHKAGGRVQSQSHKGEGQRESSGTAE